MADPNLTQELLKTLLHYDPETGIFTRLVTTSGRATKGTIAGHKHGGGYLRFCVLAQSYLSHRLAWFYMYGEWPEFIDHINRRKTDNRITNLREATHAQNMANSRNKPRPKHPDLPRGVHHNCTNTRYFASISKDGKSVYIGAYDTPEEAELAYLQAIKKYRGNFAHNLPRSQQAKIPDPA